VCTYQAVQAVHHGCAQAPCALILDDLGEIVLFLGSFVNPDEALARWIPGR
jgi:hypothetical protein